MVALPEDVKEVNDFAESDTVDQVAEGSGKNQRQGKKGQLLVFSESLDIPEDAEHGYDRYGDEEGDADSVVGEDAEGRPLVADIGQVEKTTDYRYRFVEPEVGVHVQFACLVKNQKNQADGR